MFPSSLPCFQFNIYVSKLSPLCLQVTPLLFPSSCPLLIFLFPGLYCFQVNYYLVNIMIRHPDLSMRRPVHQSDLHFPHKRKDERTVRLALCIGPHLFFGHETGIVHRHSSHSFFLFGFFLGLSFDCFFLFPNLFRLKKQSDHWTKNKLLKNDWPIALDHFWLQKFL